MKTIINRAKKITREFTHALNISENQGRKENQGRYIC